MKTLEQIRKEIEIPLMLIKGVTGLGIVSNDQGEIYLEIAVENAEADDAVWKYLDEGEFSTRKLRVVHRPKNKLH